MSNKGGNFPLLFFMAMETVEQRLIANLTPVLNGKGYTIESINYFRSKGLSGRSKLQMVIANIDNTPVTIKDCSVASKEISIIIDVNNIIEEAYDLEVSSRGCDNSLIFFRDFAKNIGKSVKIELHSVESGAFTAVLNKASSGRISFTDVDTNQKVTVPINDIKSAELIKHKEQ